MHLKSFKCEEVTCLKCLSLALKGSKLQLACHKGDVEIQQENRVHTFTNKQFH